MSKSDKRTEIGRAALELIAQNGFHGAPMAMIALKAGVGAGTIYRYFENKDVLICELYQDLEGRMDSFILEVYTTETSIRTRFVTLGARLLRFFITFPLDFRYLEQFHNSPYGAAYRRDKILGEKEGCNIFRDLFEEGIERKEMKGLPLVILFSLAFGPILAVARDHILGFIVLQDSLIEHTVEACWDAVRV